MENKQLLLFAKQNVLDTAMSIRLRKRLNPLSELKSTVAQFRLFHGMAQEHVHESSVFRC